MDSTMARSRAYRRAQVARAQARTLRTVRIWDGGNRSDSLYTDLESRPAWFGVLVSTHCRPCSCAMCSLYRGYKSARDHREALALRSALADAGLS